MMWDFSGGQDKGHRSRSRSPQPPQMRMPSPAFPTPTHQNPDPYSYGYGGQISPSYPSVGPAYGQYLTSHDYSSIPHGPSPTQQYPTHIVHVIHHSTHHKHRRHGHSHAKTSLPMPAPSPLTHTSYQPTPGGYASSSLQSQRVHFSHSEPLQVPTQRTLLQKPPPRQRTHSHSHFQPQAQQPRPTHVYQEAGSHPSFQYSECTGRRKALCIGINYRGQPNELRGCVNDAKHVREFLIKHGNYKSSDIILLTDDSRDPRSLPTRDNILQAMRRLVHHAKQNDALFLHYSGHGGQTPDLDGDEADGFDEVIFPLDFKTRGHITDDEMHDIMVKPLPRGCRLTALFDACHSGTVLDLPYIYSAHGRLKGSQISPQWLQRKSTPADVISWSGCADEETSADTFQGGVAVGAMSQAFITALTTQPKQTYQQLLTAVRHILNPRYSQKPQLGSSHHIDTNLQFIF